MLQSIQRQTGAASVYWAPAFAGVTAGEWGEVVPLYVIPSLSRDPFISPRLAVRWVLGSEPGDDD
jgi:hypothetical protein